MDAITLMPIGIIKNNVLRPRDDHWGEIESAIEIDSSQFSLESLRGIEDFSHLEVIFLMHQVDPASVPAGARHPRNLEHLPKIGIFAQRPKARPNRLGLSRCRILTREDMVIKVVGLDAINGSPVLDIKPYFSEFDVRGPVHQPEWTREIMANYY